MRFLIILLLVISAIDCHASTIPKILFANNMVVAHRGAFKAKGLPENSIASLKHSIELGCTGSEFDVHMTVDSVLVVCHDPHYNKLLIKESTYQELSKFRLSNGESLPKLSDFIIAGMENNTVTGLVCEIKPSNDLNYNYKMTEKVLALVKELKAENFIHSYISFSYDILLQIVKHDPRIKTQYLNGSKAPDELKKDGIYGLDYNLNAYKKNPHWIKRSKELGLTLNAWTANSQEDLDWFLANGFDFITTNEPELLFLRVKESPTSKGYTLVWSDEFNYTGKPDSTKWTYDYGFIANEEKQYYTDSIKNARVENGMLIIEALKESVLNKDYKNNNLENTYASYKSRIEKAPYTSARIKTEGLAEWKYGRMEARIKLPEGRGMWPAFWMLSESLKKEGWPASGEIDIMEQVGYDNNTIHGTIHTKAYNHTIGTQKGKTIYVENPNSEFHIYAIEWTPEKIDFILNGVVYNHIENEHKTTDEWPFDQKFHLILNVAVGGGWGGLKGIDENIFPQRMTVDYVRVFQFRDSENK